jgi:thioredoxin-like negative regulator of GroEL
MNVVCYQFSSPTCGPCQLIKPTLESLKEEFSQFTWVSVNVQNDPNNYTQQFGVTVVPTMVVAITDSTGKLVSSVKHSGTNIPGYYRALRSSIKYL